jgi:hypothetical protein
MRRGLRAEVDGCGSVAFFRKRLAATPAEACALGAGSSSWSASTISESSSPFVRPLPPPAAATAASRCMPFFSVVPAEEEPAGCLAFFISGGAGVVGEVDAVVDEKGRFEAAWG